MKDRCILTFDEETDAFGNRKEFLLLDYTFDFETNTEDAHTTGATPNTSILKITLQSTADLTMQEWGMANLTCDGVFKNGDITIFSHDEDMILRHLRFEKAECIKLTNGGQYDEALGYSVNTIDITFLAKALAIDDVNIIGEIRPQSTTTVEPSVHERAMEENEDSAYTLENTYIHEHLKSIATEITKEFEADNDNALYQVYRKIANGEITNPVITVVKGANTMVHYDTNTSQIIVREADLIGIQEDNDTKLKLCNSLAQAYGKYIDSHLDNEKGTITASSLLQFDAIETKNVTFGQLTSPDYTGELTLEVSSKATKSDWSCLVLEFGYSTTGFTTTTTIGTSQDKAKEIIPIINNDLGYFGYHPTGKNTDTTLTKDLDPIVAQWLEKETKKDHLTEKLKSGIRYQSGSMDYIMMMQLRIFLLSTFGNQNIKDLCNSLEKSKHTILIKDSDAGNTSAFSSEKYGKLALNIPEYPDFPFKRTKQNEKKYNDEVARIDKIREEWEAIKPNLQSQVGIGDSCTIRLSCNQGIVVSKEGQAEIAQYNIKRTDLTVLLHESYHAWRIGKGLIQHQDEEEKLATQFVNSHLRSKHNRRPVYRGALVKIDIPLEDKYKKNEKNNFYSSILFTSIHNI